MEIKASLFPSFLPFLHPNTTVTRIYVMPCNSCQFCLSLLFHTSVHSKESQTRQGNTHLALSPAWGCGFREQRHHRPVPRLLVAAAVSGTFHCAAVFLQSIKPQNLQQSCPAGTSLQYQNLPLPASPLGNFLFSIPRFQLLMTTLGIYKDGSPSN